MAQHKTPPLTWQLENSSARFAHTATDAVLDLKSTASGLKINVDPKHSICGNLFCTELNANVKNDSHGSFTQPLNESFVRGDELHLSYGPTEACPFHLQQMWEARFSNGCEKSIPSIRMTLSVYTELLDSKPSYTVASNLNAQETLILSDDDEFVPVQLSEAISQNFSCILFRFADGSQSYCEMIHPNERIASEVFTEGTDTKVCWSLFSGQLEKGVIRSACLEGFFLPRENDEELAKECYQASLERDLNLSA